MKGVTAIIPVRSGSVRCPRKNDRDFNGTTLLQLKINTLKRVKGISKIIVSSSDDQLLKIAKDTGVAVHKRDSVYSTSETTGSELFRCLADAVDDTHMMYVTCVAPFVTPGTYENAIDTYFANIENSQFDSVVSCRSVKEFLWLDKTPLNYNPSCAPPSQLLPDINALTFGFNILRTEYVKRHHSIVGKNPYLYKLSQMEAVDIDTSFDFTVSELLYSNGFSSIKDIDSHNRLTVNKDFVLLDCTVRDGGYLNNWNFTYNEVLDMYMSVSRAGIEYFEVGFICTPDLESNGRWWNVTRSDILQLKMDTDYRGTKIAAMVHLEDLYKLYNTNEKIPYLDMVRVLVNPIKNNLNDLGTYKSYLRKLVSLGYKVCLNIAYIGILSHDKLNKALELVVPGIEYIYIADTFGGITPKDLKYLIRCIGDTLGHQIKIGFHGHNNTQRAISNSLDAIKCGVSIVDITIGGMGRGGGNTQNEIFLQHVNVEFEKNYDILHILEYLDKQGIETSEQLKILHTLTGLYQLHPNIANESLKEYKTLVKAYNSVNTIKLND
jgi:CMP-N-acetylneuraminic acid synthetase